MKAIIAVVVIGVVVLLAFLESECESCKGSGKTELKQTHQVPCDQCGGKGSNTSKMNLKAPAKSKGQLGDDKRTCLKCKGKGTISEELPAGDCLVCKGKGKIKLYEKLTR